jgi:hypothetical protein
MQPAPGTVAKERNNHPTGEKCEAQTEEADKNITGDRGRRIGLGWCKGKHIFSRPDKCIIYNVTVLAGNLGGGKKPKMTFDKNNCPNDKQSR